MKSYVFSLIALFFISACSFKKQMTYVQDARKKTSDSWTDYTNFKNNIEINDILKIDVLTTVPEASKPYNSRSKSDKQSFVNNMDILRLEGYLVNEDNTINFPVLGKIEVGSITEFELERKIEKLLIDGNHLTNPIVKVRRINSKFTVLGQVTKPGTYSYFGKKLNIFQALGYAGDITIDGKAGDITLVREKNGKNIVYSVSLTKSEILNSSNFFIKNNDIIVVNPTFSKIKSAGFIGNPSSVASIASLLLSITLLITNN